MAACSFYDLRGECLRVAVFYRGGAPESTQFIWGLMLRNLKFGSAFMFPMQPISGAPRCAPRIKSWNHVQDKTVLRDKQGQAWLQREKSCSRRRACVASARLPFCCRPQGR